MKKKKTLVVGQGIAGSLVAFKLYQNNIPFVVMDPALNNSSSLVAAGMFTPITGKRKTIDQLTLQQIPFAIECYRSIEMQLGKSILHLNNIYQVFDSETERKELLMKATKPEFKNYIIADPQQLSGIQPSFGAVEITNSGWVDCTTFINSTRDWLKGNNAWITGTFDYDKLSLNNGVVEYDQQVDTIIFCEGYRGMDNPFFKDAAIVPCKGDVLTLTCEGLADTHIIKKSGIYLVRIGENTFKAGATYQWHNSSTQPDENSKNEIEIKLNSLLKNGYKVKSHLSGIRPTTHTRAVIVKQHTVYKNMFMLNGLGTKGIIQGPWWANHLVEKLITKNE
ncbi:MAG: FAD-dependent oxidoreductase [Ferruginibacter sp.]